MRFLAFIALVPIAAFSQLTQHVSVSTGAPGYWFASSGFSGPAVTGAPYSAEENSENVQILVDGTHITQKFESTKYYRDSAGRTRTERWFPRPTVLGQTDREADPDLIEINDPVAHTRYILNAREKVVTKMTMAVPEPRPGAKLEGGRAGAFFSAAASPGMAVPQQPLAHAASGPAPDAVRPELKTEDLGTQTIDGFLVKGTRMTTTWPVGAMGNDRPITSINETWRSPELQIQVLSKFNDPRNGEHTQKLTNIVRGEPDASLFQLPADYTVKEQ